MTQDVVKLSIDPQKHMEKTDLTHTIDRLESMEDSAGVTLNAMSAFLTHRNSLCINGEVIFIKPIEKRRQIRVKAVVYDSDGRVVDTVSDEIGEAQIPFDAFSLICHDLQDTVISRIRIFPVRRIIGEYGFEE